MFYNTLPAKSLTLSIFSDNYYNKFLTISYIYVSLITILFSFLAFYKEYSWMIVYMVSIEASLIKLPISPLLSVV